MPNSKFLEQLKNAGAEHDQSAQDTPETVNDTSRRRYGRMDEHVELSAESLLVGSDPEDDDEDFDGSFAGGKASRPQTVVPPVPPVPSASSVPTVVPDATVTTTVASVEEGKETREYPGDGQNKAENRVQEVPKVEQNDDKHEAAADVGSESRQDGGHAVNSAAGEGEKPHEEPPKQEAPKRKRPGPPPGWRKRLAEQQEAAKKEEEAGPKPKDEIKVEPDVKQVQKGDFVMPDYSDMEIQDVVLDYVCRKLFLGLKDSFDSKMYTKAFMQDLMQRYINGEIDASDPLFKSLVHEIIESDVKDPYLDGLTKNVLEFVYNDGD